MREVFFDKIIKFSLYLLVFLLPLFFLPVSVFPVALNKQMLLVLFVFWLSFLWVIRVINSGRFSFLWDELNIAILLAFLVGGLSMALSGSSLQSFWGEPTIPTSFFNFILYILVFLLFANFSEILYKTSPHSRSSSKSRAAGNEAGSRWEVLRILSIFSVSCGLLAIIFLAHSFLDIFPWDFAKVSGFNPVGSACLLSVFLGGGFVVFVAILTNTKMDELRSLFGVETLLPLKLFQFLLLIFGVSLFVAIFLINFWPTWLGIALGMGIILWEALKHPVSLKIKPFGSQESLKNFIVPAVISVIVLIFIFIKLPFDIIELPDEATPSYRATFIILQKTLEESPKNFFLGSGPVTFLYQYRLYKPLAVNLSPFWQTDFEQGKTAFLTFSVEWGVLGMLALFFVVGIFLYRGFEKIGTEKPVPLTVLGSFVGGFYFLFSWFFSQANLSLMFGAFLMMGLLVQAISQKTTKKTLPFLQSSKRAFLVITACIIFTVGIFVGLYATSQKYLAAVNYAQGLDLLEAEKSDLDGAISKLQKAAELDGKDVYFRDLSQLSLLKANEILGEEESAPEQRQEQLEKNFDQAELSALTATQINPRDSINWIHLGAIYENLALWRERTDQSAVSSYRKARALDPQNPQVAFNLARVYKSIADRIRFQMVISGQPEEEQEAGVLQELIDKSSELALEELKETINLKSDFVSAYLLMAQIYEEKGDNGQALGAYKILLQLLPGNEQLQDKINELEGKVEE